MNIIEPLPPETPLWFNNDCSTMNTIIPLPSKDDTNLISKYPFHDHDKDIKFKAFQLAESVDNSLFDMIYAPPSDLHKKINHLKTLHQKRIDKMKLKDISEKEFDIAIKSMSTKLNKKIDNINNIVKTRTFEVRFDKTQQNILFNWIRECIKVYNFCVDLYNNDNTYFNKGYMAVKTDIFTAIYGKNDKPAPFDTLTDEIRAFCTNLASCYSNLANNNINHFQMTHKAFRYDYSLFISHKSITQKGLFPVLLRKQIMNNNIDIDKIQSDCRLYYNGTTDKFYLKCPMYFTKKEVLNRNPICALDPGESIFMTFYGLESYGMIGEDIRKPILECEKRIRQLHRLLGQNLNREGNRIKNKKSIKKRIRKYYMKIRNKVNELHNQTALYLCKNYEKILIPKFETSKMVKNKIIRNKENKTKEELKKYSRIGRLNGRVKFVLNNLSHYRFRQHLTNKGSEYGCEIIEVTEEYTSQLCPNCCKIEKKYEGRIKTCSKCNYKINRDISGSRMILIKNH